jgi:hypothetical protein
MDPLSIAASIAGLVTLVDMVFSRTVSHVKAIKSTQSDLSRLAIELATLAETLHSLWLLAARMEAESLVTAINSKHVDGCRATLKEIMDRLNKL